MTEREFVVLRGGAFDPVKPGLTGVAAVVAKRLVRGEGPFQRRFNHLKRGHAMPRRVTLGTFMYQVKQGEVGDTHAVLNGRGVEVVRVREVQSAPTLIDISGNHKADLYWTACLAKFPHARYAGSYVCKVIAGTHIHSQHSYGNAVDVFPGAGESLDTMAHWAISQASVLRLKRVIWRDREWKEGVEFTYTGEYHSHVHVDFQVEVDSSRPCGVRENGP